MLSNKLFIIVINFLVGHTYITKADNNLISVDVNKNYPKKELILQDLFDVEYLPLETKDESITFGFIQDVSEKWIVARDINQMTTGNIFLFDRKGKFIRKINRRGNGPEEYIHITGINIDELHEEILVYSNALRKILVYDLYGNFKRSFKYMKQESEIRYLDVDFRFDPIFCFNKDLLIFEDYSSGRIFLKNDWDLRDRNIFYIITKSNGSLVKEIEIPYEKKVVQALVQGEKIGYVRNPGIIPYKNHWLLMEAAADTIYSYSSTDGLKPFIARKPSIHEMNPKLFLFPGVVTDRYCFMQGVKLAFEDSKSGELQKINWVYDLNEQTLFEYEIYNSDFTNKKITTNLTDNILSLKIFNNDKIAFVERLEAADLIEAYQAGKLRGKLKEVAASLNEESNPIIMLAKYK